MLLILDFASSQLLLLSLAAHLWLTVSISGWLYSQPSLAKLDVYTEVSPYSHEAKSLNITRKPSKVCSRDWIGEGKKHWWPILGTSYIFIVGALAIGRVRIDLKTGANNLGGLIFIWGFLWCKNYYPHKPLLKWAGQKVLTVCSKD